MRTFRSEITRNFLLTHHMGLIVIAAIASGVVANKLLMGVGLDRVIIRYPVSVTGSFLAFVLCMRLWLEYLRRYYTPHSPVMDFDDEPPATSSSDEKKSSKWSDVVSSLPDPGINSACGCLLVLFLILVVLVGGSAFILVCEAPIILADVAFQFFLTAGLVRSTKAIDSPSWVGSVIKHAWKPFVIVLISSIVFGGFAEISCKNPNSIIEMIRSCGK